MSSTPQSNGQLPGLETSGGQPPSETGRVILLDLNSTLAENGSSYWNLDQRSRPDYGKWIATSETYRSWLVELCRNETVVLITVRNERHRAKTISRISDTCNWTPQVALFNTTSQRGAAAAPGVKQSLLSNEVFPQFGEPDNQYLALESNAASRAMYARNGIYATPVSYGRPWEKLP
jgi:hypothetical protein